MPRTEVGSRRSNASVANCFAVGRVRHPAAGQNDLPHPVQCWERAGRRDLGSVFRSRRSTA